MMLSTSSKEMELVGHISMQSKPRLDMRFPSLQIFELQDDISQVLRKAPSPGIKSYGPIPLAVATNTSNRL
jgi:hypothetical protein